MQANGKDGLELILVCAHIAEPGGDARQAALVRRRELLPSLAAKLANVMALKASGASLAPSGASGAPTWSELVQACKSNGASGHQWNSQSLF
jgi:hypothetical protein